MNSTRTPSPSRAWCALGIFALAWLTATAVGAATVTVDCDGGAADFPSITAALASLTPTDPNTVTVSGTCIESVSISGFGSLVVEAAGAGATLRSTGSAGIVVSGSAPVRLSGFDLDLTASGLGLFVSDAELSVTGSDIFGASDGIFAQAEATLTLGGPAAADAVTVRDHVLTGITIVGGSELILDGNVTVEDNPDSISISGAVLRSNGHDVGNTIRNNGFGLIFVNSEASSLRGLHTIENNGSWGLLAIRTDRVVASTYPGLSSGPPFYGIHVRNHDVWGVLVVSADIDFQGPTTGEIVHSVTDNGGAPQNRDAGVWVGRDSVARLRNIDISDNFGHGVHGTLGGHVNLLNATIDDNSRHGVRLSWNATGELGSFSLEDGTTIGPDVSLSGNGRRAIKCAHSSVLAGNRSGIADIDCDNSSSFTGGTGGSDALAGDEVTGGDDDVPGLTRGGDLELLVEARIAELEARVQRIARAAR